MRHYNKYLIPGAAALLLLSTASQASEAACDRSCLKGFADKLVASVVAHDPTKLPLSQVYAATENSIPSALNMMVIWRTTTAAKGSYYVIDPQSEQVFLIVTISEGASDTLLYGRLKVHEGLISELELYTTRSRGEGGFTFGPEGVANFPAAWTIPVAPERRMSRAQLLQAGRSIFDTSVPAPDPAPGCLLMEDGKVVGENPDVLKFVGGSAQPAQDSPPRNPDGTVPIPCGNPPGRPTDKNARTDIADEELGVVVSLAVVHGMVEPYVITNPTESAFVPNAMLDPYAKMLKLQQSSGKYHAPAVRPMPATQAVAELHRIYDGKMQGLMMLHSTGAPGSRSPWVTK